MSQTLKHLKVSTIADGPDPNQVNPSDWNAAHVFTGGALGGLLMRDTGDATFGASWLASVAAGSVLISNGVGAAPTWASSLVLGGTLTVNGAGGHIFNATIAGANALTIQNNSNANTAYVALVFGNDTGAAAYLQLTSSTYNGSGGFDAPGALAVVGTKAGGLAFVAQTGTMRFYSGGFVERLRIDAIGAVLINTATNAGGGMLAMKVDGSLWNAIALQNTHTGNAINFLLMQNSAGATAGSIAQTGATTVAFQTTSDRRLKADHGRATDLSALRALVVHEFRWTVDGVSDRGVFAQEAAAIYPRAITVGSDDRTPTGELVRPWMADYSKFVPDLIVGFHDHDARLEAIEHALAVARG